MREVILKNAAECAKCHDLIESVHVHDFRGCKCGRIAVDGGREYLRRLYLDDSSNLIEHSVVEYHPLAQWLSHNLASALVRRSGEAVQKTIHKTLVGLLKWIAVTDIMRAVRELPFTKNLTPDDLTLLETTLREELIGKTS